MKTIYTIEYMYYNNKYLQDFDDSPEDLEKLWAEVDYRATQGGRGNDEQFQICRYEIPDDLDYDSRSHRYSTGKSRPSGGTYYADTASIKITKTYLDDDGDEQEEEETLDPVATVDVSYYDSFECEDKDDENYGKWLDENGDVYETEEELHEAFAPSSFYDLP